MQPNKSLTVPCGSDGVIASAGIESEVYMECPPATRGERAKPPDIIPIAALSFAIACAMSWGLVANLAADVTGLPSMIATLKAC